MKILRVLFALVVAACVFAIASAAWYWAPLYNLVRETESGTGYNPFATRVYKPLEVVKGARDDTAFPLAEAAGDARFAAAIAIAEQEESYALLVWHRGALRLERYWQGGTRDARGESASMHKSVVALAVLAAIADGKIQSLDQPVGDFIGEWRGDERGRITLRQVMQMTSGLEGTKRTGWPISETTRLRVGFWPERLVLSRALVRPPGTLFDYQNVNSQLLGMIVERATGERYAGYLSRRLWRPIGADDSFVTPDRPGGMAKTWAALLARPLDWLRLGLLLKNDGRWNGTEVLPASLVREMLTPSPANPKYGLQIWFGEPHAAERFYAASAGPRRGGLMTRSSAPFLAPDLFFFDGFGGQRVYVSAALDLVVVRMGRIRQQWDDSLLFNAVVQNLP
jgi:CubicO group peptidase (beta-lactamase class C family)